MKKTVLILLLALFIFTLCACEEDSAAQDLPVYLPPATDNPPITADTDISIESNPDTVIENNTDTDTATPPPVTLPSPDMMLSPTPQPEPQVIICIDPGHGGKDAGAVWEDRMEKDDALKLAFKVAEQVEALGQKAILTRTDDSYPYFSERADIANNANADIFISLHRNSFVGANGVEIWISYKASSDTVSFAEDMIDALAEVGISKDRGVKKGTTSSSKEDYYVNRLTDMPSCIIELGFITSDEDNRLYDENMDGYAKAIAEQAIKEALRIQDQAK